MTGSQLFITRWLDGAVRLYVKLRLALLILFLIILIAGSLYVFLWATGPYGIGVRTDSVAYLWSSENLVKGFGLGRLNGLGEFRPMTHWPPLYPFLLTLPQLFGLNSLSAARVFGAVSIGLMVLLLGLSISRLTRGSPWYTGLGTLVLVTSYALWNTSLYAMTEPLYMVLGLAAFLFLDNYLSTRKSFWLVITAVLLALGLLTRYAAGALVIASVLVLIIQPGQSVKAKFKDVIILCSIAILPLALWMIRNVLLADTATNRILEFAPIPVEEWNNFKNLAVGWIVPILKLDDVSLPRLTLVLFAAIFLAWFTGRSGSSGRRESSRLWLIYLFYAFSYTAYIFMAKVFFDQTIPLGEERIFLPLYSSVAMLIIYGLFLLEQHLVKRRALRIALVSIYALVAIGFIRGSIPTSAAYAKLSNEKGLGLANVDVTGMDIIPVIKNLSSGPVIFSDDLEVLYFLTGRPSFQINAVTSDQIKTVRELLAKRGVYIILFKKHELGEQLKAGIPQLELIHSGSGVIYSGGLQP
jgi:hypothetical protein